ncbi:MAG: Fis family transcriptional regulator, partial [Candidatus Phosphoribacter sp.]
MTTTTITAPGGARYDAGVPAIVITALTLTHPGVTAEALRWSTGSRGPAVSAGELDGADLTAYVEQAVVVGAQAIAVAGGTQDTFNLEQLVTYVGVRTAESAAHAVETTTRVVGDATKAVSDASAEARKAIADASEISRKAFAEAVAQAEQGMRRQIGQLLGGEDPELLARLKPVLESFGADLTRRAGTHTTDLFERATRALDADDPTSPMAKHLKALDARQADLATRWDKHHHDLTGKLAELTTAIQVQRSATQAAKATASVTPLKGGTYEDAIHQAMHQVAVGLGDEYLETGTKGGAISGHNKKGDGVLVVGGGPARVVLEMTDSASRDWGNYLDEAERNRQAGASLGLVPALAQNAGQGLRVLGPRRVVMAFDPAQDDLGLLRSVVQLLRMAAIAA